ncbi:hypothetical protein HMPREF1986_02665 [Oribacterium sp. oral taxon 078 str. F0263]|nr:hypothetical protein HMPREF1986_02665 [Oribacterium sp. oral taxon 078 str. F0263]
MLCAAGLRMKGSRAKAAKPCEESSLRHGKSVRRGGRRPVYESTGPQGGSTGKEP